MNAGPIVVHDTAAELADVVATRLVARIGDVLARRGVVHVALTGGGIGTASLAAIRSCPAAHGLDWSRVHLWWGDERFLPAGHEDRNATQAEAALLGALRDGLEGAVPPGRRLLEAHVHPMPSTGSPTGDDVIAAASFYAEQLRLVGGDEATRRLPALDVVLLGVGPDGHVASLFPGHPALADSASVVPVVGSPKPPPVRVSLGLQAINAARAVWLIASGASKAQAVSDAVRGGREVLLPAARVAGVDETLWLLDADAAADLPGRAGLVPGVGSGHRLSMQ